MPEVRVQDEQGKVHVFPEGSTPEMIAEAMHVQPPSAAAPPKQPGVLDKLKTAAVTPTVGASMPGGGEVYDPVIHKIENFLGEHLGPEKAKVLAGISTFPLHWLNSMVKIGRAQTSPLGVATLGAGGLTGTAGRVAGAVQGAVAAPEGAKEAYNAITSPDMAPAERLERGLSGTAAALAGVAGVKSGAGAVAGKVGAKLAPKLYKSALKPSTTIPAGKVDQIVKTGLQEQIPVSEKGVERIANLVDDLNDQISAGIGAGAGKTVNKFAVASRLGQTAERFQKQVNPNADLRAISDAGNEFLENQPGAIPAADAQALKQGTYQQLSSKAYGEMQTATKEAQKALARGIKEELEVQFPELKNLNARESKLFALGDVLERAVNRIGNHQLFGIGTPIAAGAIKAVSGSGKLAAAGGVVKMVLDNPVVKSRLAIALSQAGKGRIPPAVAAGRVAAYVSALSAAVSSDSQSQSPNQ